MNPDDIPRAWTLRLSCNACGLPIVYPSRDCPECVARAEEALHLRNTMQPIYFPATEDI